MVRNFYDQAQQSTTDALETALKIQEIAEATGDLIGNKIANKITKITKTVCFRIILRQLKLKQRYLKEDIYLQKKERKLMMIQD